MRRVIEPKSTDGADFRRFAKTMRALIAVPKAELNQKLADEKAKRHTNGNGSRKRKSNV